jgi:excisionase family DNA binding protein
VKNRAAKQYNPRVAEAGAESVPVSEAARLTGLSVQTLKRVCAAGQLEAFRSPGEHVRVLRIGLQGFLKDASPASTVPASSVLANKRALAEVRLQREREAERRERERRESEARRQLAEFQR